MPRTRPSSVELFTGGGGLALALHQEGYQHLLAVESDTRAADTLLANHAVPHPAGEPVPAGRWPLVGGDVRDVDFTGLAGRVDVVAGGVPCQPWSLGGAHRGYDDPRNLWPELFRCVRQTRPAAVLAENVRGLLRPSFAPYYEYIRRELSAPFERRIDGENWFDHDRRLRKALRGHGVPDERYRVRYLLMNAADYGVPQVRWRVFVVAFRMDLEPAGWRFPAPTHSDHALARAKADGTYWDRHGLPVRPGADPGADDGLAPWRTLRDAIADLPEPRDRVEHPDFAHHYGWPGARQYPGHTPNELDRPAKTVKAGVHGVPGGESVLRRDDGTIRYLTVREVARVMTFPDRWRLSGPRGEQMRQLGNAVPVALGRVLARSIAEALGDRS